MSLDAAVRFLRYKEFQQYVGWTEKDAQRVHDLSALVEPDLEAIVEDFYEEIDRHPNAKRVITQGQPQIDRLKRTLLGWLTELFDGRYDEDYVSRRWQVGWRHVEIGLAQAYTNVALARLRQSIVRAVRQRWTGDAAELNFSLASLDRLIDLDLAIITDAYDTESRMRVQRTERLAAIGQVAGGIAHELRNPLNVVKTSVYYLLNARNPSPTRTQEHLQRIDRQVGVADCVITALSNFAKMPLPNARPFPLGRLVEAALETHVIPDSITVEAPSRPDLPNIVGDADQLAIVLGNLIRNACDAMGASGGTLTIDGEELPGPAIAVHVRDTGVGIESEKLNLITEPLYSTKTRGIGLGLAISKAILQKNMGTMQVASELGVGSVFTIILPAVFADESNPQ